MNNLDEVQERWKARIVDECARMAEAINGLRELAKHADDPKFSEMVNELQALYCQMANSVTLRLLLNGAIAVLADCGEKHDDSKPGA